MSYLETTENYYVLDKNCMRGKGAEFAKEVLSRENAKALVIDTMILEHSRPGNFAEHFQKDFRDWTDVPERMHVSFGGGPLMKEECKTGQRCKTVVDCEYSDSLQDCLIRLGKEDHSFLNGADRRADGEVEKLCGPGGEWSLEQRQKWDMEWKNKLRKKGVDSRCQKLRSVLHSDDPTSEFGEFLFGEIVTTFIHNCLIEGGFLNETASALLSKPSFTGMLHYTKVASVIATWRSEKENKTKTNSSKFLNQEIDQDYIAYALCCRGLISNDKLMVKIEKAVRRACKERWPSN